MPAAADGADGLVVLRRVVKTFGTVKAIRDVSMTLHAGEVVALLGHNGAGKTVLVRMLSTLAWPTSGSVTVAGHDARWKPVDVRKNIGTCLDGPLLWPDLTGYQTLRIVADAHGIGWPLARSRSGEVLSALNFPLPRDTPVGHYSLGMKRKLALAASLVGDVRVLVWDEPEIGLDPVSRVAFRRLVRRLRNRGLLIFLTTHAMDFAEAVADRVAVLLRGRLVALDTPCGLRASRGRDASLEDAILTVLSESSRGAGLSTGSM